MIDLVGLDRTAADHMPAHAMGRTPREAGSLRGPRAVRRANHGGERTREAYGDFDSYASLALADAN